MAARLARAGLSLAYGTQVDTVGPVARGAKRAGGGIVVSIEQLGSGAGVELHGSRGFEVLAGGMWVSTSIESHTKDTVTLADVANGTKLRYNWYSNPCGYYCFECAVYVTTTPVVPGLSGEEPFLPLPPFFAEIS